MATLNTNQISFTFAPEYDISLDYPSDAVTLDTQTPQLKFTGSYITGGDLMYEIALCQDSGFTGTTLTDVLSSEYVTVDSYKEAYKDTETISSYQNGEYVAQSFMGDGSTLDSIKLYTYRNGTGTGRVHIFAHSGTFGVDGMPTGTELAVSNEVQSGTSYALTTFTFSGANRIVLEKDTPYFWAAENYSPASSGDNLHIGGDSSTPSAPGNSAYLNPIGWNTTTTAGIDFCYYVYGYKPNGSFVDITNASDTTPFASGDQIGFTTPNTDVQTFYFDAHNGMSDPQNAWQYDSEAFDGNFSTGLSSSTQAAFFVGSNVYGSTSQYYLQGDGTNATGSGEIESVYVAVKSGFGSAGLQNWATVFSGSEELGTASTVGGDPDTISDYVKLLPPTGGWDWTKLANLSVKLYTFDTGDLYSGRSSGALLKVHMGGNKSLDQGPTYYWKVRESKDNGVTWSDWSSVRTFDISAVPTYTASHSSDANKRKQSTATHTTDSMVRTSSDYTRGSASSLPITSAELANTFSGADYSTVSAEDSTYVNQTGDRYALFEFKKENSNSSDNVTFTWSGKSNIAPSTRPVFVEVWNNTSSAWEQVASNNTASANTNFTLSYQLNTNLSDYYVGNVVTFRVYQ